MWIDVQIVFLREVAYFSDVSGMVGICNTYGRCRYKYEDDIKIDLRESHYVLSSISSEKSKMEFC